jgi:hypothetical protein
MPSADLNISRISKEIYGPEHAVHQFEQYKLCVEMADRISARRMLANSFFVGVHTALITAFTVLIKENILAPTPLGLLPFIAVITLCFVWFRVVHSYRQLNSGKFKVIHALEQLLPTAPFDSEWEALGRGKDSKLYLPLTHVENWVPVCFGLLYALLGLYLYCKA